MTWELYYTIGIILLPVFCFLAGRFFLNSSNKDDDILLYVLALLISMLFALLWIALVPLASLICIIRMGQERAKKVHERS